jgi:hypothetical protein
MLALQLSGSAWHRRLVSTELANAIGCEEQLDLPANSVESSSSRVVGGNACGLLELELWNCGQCIADYVLRTAVELDGGWIMSLQLHVCEKG